MRSEPSPPLAGFFRVLYFLAAAAVTISVVVTGVVSLYEPPGGGGSQFQFEDQSDFQFEEDASQENYNRNFGLILGLVGTAFMATGILALGSRFNPLRCGLLFAGLELSGVGVGVGASGSDNWLTFLVSALAFATVIGSALWIDEGFPIGGAGPPARRLDIGPPPSVGPPPSQ